MGMVEILLKDVMRIVRRGQVPKDKRSVIIQMLVDILTELGVVVFYYDDMEARRRDGGQPLDTPVPME